MSAPPHGRAEGFPPTKKEFHYESYSIEDRFFLSSLDRDERNWKIKIITVHITAKKSATGSAAKTPIVLSSKRIGTM